MDATRAAPKEMDAYIAGFPAPLQRVLGRLRATIRKAAPDARETISYRMPAYTLNGRPLVYFAGYAKHVSIYPAPRGAEAFREKLAAYEGGKGTVRFPLDRPVPLRLVGQIVRFRVAESLERTGSRRKAK